MKAKIYVGAKKYALYIGRKIIQKTLEFLTLPARFISKKVQELKNLTMWGNSKQQLLPDGYTQLEYIESTGTQYIVLPKEQYVSGEELEIDFAYTTFSGSFPTIYGSSLSEIYTNSTGDVLSYGNIQISEPQKFILNQKQKIKANFTTDITTIAQGLLAYRQSGNNYVYMAQGKLYKFIDRLNGVDVYNMLPAKRNSDNTLGMYDLVTNTFFTNAGTGTFIAGNVAPTPTAPIKIESVGEKISNLFDGEWEYGNIDANGNVIISTTPTAWIHGKNRIKVKPNTRYWFRLFGDVTRYQAQFYIIGYDKDDKFTTGKRVSVGDIILNVDGYYYDMASNVEYIRFFYYHTIEESTSLDTNRYKLSIEERSDVIPSYEPYGYKVPVMVGDTTTNIYLPEPLRKIGEYADTLSVDGTNVTVVRNVGVLGTEELANAFQRDGNASSTYIGSQYVRIFSNDTQTLLTKYYFGGAYASRNNRFNVLCTKLVPLNTDFSLSTYKYGMVGIDSSLNLFIDTTKPANTTEMAQRIRDLGLKLVLPLNTPTTETYTIEQPINLPQGTLSLDTDTKIKPSKINITGDIDNE